MPWKIMTWTVEKECSEEGRQEAESKESHQSMDMPYVNVIT